MSAVLKVEGLKVDIGAGGGMLHAVRGVDLSVAPGETLCIVGESGCGKSMTSLAMMGLLPKAARIEATRLEFDGEDLLRASERRMSDLRGNRMAMIFQDPMTSLNPSYTIGNQLEEVFLRHCRAGRKQARDRAIHLLERVGITAAERRLSQYPHQLSGGLRQRVMIAMALMCEPDLLIADEPTTALDVTIQAQILRLLAELQQEFKMALILITHDLGVVARIADRVAVMYAGEIVEKGPATAVFDRPSHPYTMGLLESIPIRGKTPPGARLGTIPGIVPALYGDLVGCQFAPRCSFRQAICTAQDIAPRHLEADHSYRCILEPAELPAAKRSAQ